MVDLLALAHDRGCEAELADLLAADLEAGRLPDMSAVCAHFAPDPRACRTWSSTSSLSPPTRTSSAPATEERRHEDDPGRR